MDDQKTLKPILGGNPDSVLLRKTVKLLVDHLSLEELQNLRSLESHSLLVDTAIIISKNKRGDKD